MLWFAGYLGGLEDALGKIPEEIGRQAGGGPPEVQVVSIQNVIFGVCFHLPMNWTPPPGGELCGAHYLAGSSGYRIIVRAAGHEYECLSTRDGSLILCDPNVD